MATISQTALASQFVSRLWSAVIADRARQGAISSSRHLRQAFDPAWLGTLPLPLGDGRSPTQTVALVNGREFDRKVDGKAIDAAYHSQPRTRVYEDISTRSDGWFGLVTLQLAALARCRTVCTMYESAAGDIPTIPHVDAWYGAIVQMRGAKAWSISDGEGDRTEQIVTRAGDLLLMPPDVRHAVSTPESSVHLVFAFLTGEPIGS